MARLAEKVLNPDDLISGATYEFRSTLAVEFSWAATKWSNYFQRIGA